jgi:hypothetical protein
MSNIKVDNTFCGGMPCPNVLNMPLMIAKFFRTNYFHQGNTISFVENYHLDEEKWEGVARVA